MCMNEEDKSGRNRQHRYRINKSQQGRKCRVDSRKGDPWSIHSRVYVSMCCEGVRFTILSNE